jgi:hypothetical protein
MLQAVAQPSNTSAIPTKHSHMNTVFIEYSLRLLTFWIHTHAVSPLPPCFPVPTPLRKTVANPATQPVPLIPTSFAGTLAHRYRDVNPRLPQSASGRRGSAGTPPVHGLRGRLRAVLSSTRR